MSKKTSQAHELPDFAALITRVHISAICVLVATLSLPLALLLLPSMFKFSVAVAGLALITLVVGTTVLLHSTWALRKGSNDLDRTLNINITDLLPKQDRD